VLLRVDDNDVILFYPLNSADGLESTQTKQMICFGTPFPVAFEIKTRNVASCENRYRSVIVDFIKLLSFRIG